MKYFFLFFLFITNSFLYAQEFKGTRGVALSGALHGSLALNEGIYHNPASIAFSERYSIEGISSFLPSQQKKEPAWIYGGSIVDSHSPLFAAGISYYHKSQGLFKDHVYHLAISKPVSENLSLGVTGKYVHQDFLTRSESFFDIDGGVYYIFTPAIQFGVTGHNLLAKNDEFEREVGVGSRIKVWDFLYMDFDFVKNIDAPWTKNGALLAGLEVAHNNGVIFQSGVSLSDQSSKNLYSAGLGWAKHKFGVFYAYQNSMDALARQTHVLSLRVFF